MGICGIVSAICGIVSKSVLLLLLPLAFAPRKLPCHTSFGFLSSLLTIECAWKKIMEEEGAIPM